MDHINEMLGKETTLESVRWNIFLELVSGREMMLSHDNLMMISECGVDILPFHWNSFSFKL